MQIIPSMLVQSQEEFQTQLLEVQKHISMVQIDIADGNFVPSTTWSDPHVTQGLLEIDCELHLMVSDPIAEMKKWKDVKQVKRILFHHESVEESNIQQVLANIKSNGWQAGLVLNPTTGLSVIEKHAEQLDAVMLMGVQPGSQGQHYIHETTERLATVKNMYPNLFVSLDGGVNLDTLPEIAQSNLDAICPGSAVFHTEKTIQENITDIVELINRLTQ